MNKPPSLACKTIEAGALLQIAVAKRRLEIEDRLLFFQHNVSGSQIERDKRTVLWTP